MEFCDLPVELLVLGVSSIIGRSHGEQHDVTSCGLLEGQGDGDAPTLTGQVGLHAENCSTATRTRVRSTCQITKEKDNISHSCESLRLGTCLHGLATSHVVWVVEVGHPGLGSVSHVHLQFVGASQLSELLLQVIHNLGDDDKDGQRG